MFDYINKLKAIGDQLSCLDVAFHNEDVVMTILQSFPNLFDHLIAALKPKL